MEKVKIEPKLHINMKRGLRKFKNDFKAAVALEEIKIWLK